MNLKTLFDDKYIVSLEKSWYCESPKPKDRKAAFYQIKGRYGVVYPWDADFVEVYVTSGRKIASLERNVNWRVKNQYDDATAFLLALTDISEAWRVIKPTKRKHYSAEHRKAACERLAQWRFTQKITGNEAAQPNKNEKAGLSVIRGV